MKAYIFLAISVIGEIFATTMLKMSEGFTILFPSIGAIAGYGLSFYFLALTLKTIPLSLAYAIWAGVGTALTVLVSVALWEEVLSILKIIGILLIISGVAVLSATKSKENATMPSN